MKKKDFKDANAQATKRQTFAVYCMSKTDVRDYSLTRWECSQLIGKLKESKGSTQDKANLVKKFTAKLLNETAAALFDKEGKQHPLTVGAVVKHKASKKKAATDQLAILQEAQNAGRAAMDACIPQPMVVQQHASVLDDNSPVKKQWVVPQGVCGFAWVVVKCKGPGVKFINALKKAGIAGGENSHCDFSKSSYHKGFYHHIHDGGQSYEKKSAYARAFAEVLSKHEIPCYSGSRLD